jgi:hypothetical protein
MCSARIGNRSNYQEARANNYPHTRAAFHPLSSLWGELVLLLTPYHEVTSAANTLSPKCESLR